MAEQSKEIKRRIKSVSNIKQITRAMELVSTSKLRKSRKQLELTRPYYNTVESSIREILANTKGVKYDLLERREVKNRLIIVLTSDRGLAGGYNINVIRKAESYIDDKVGTKFILVGVEAREYFKRRYDGIVEEFSYISEEPSYNNAAKIGSICYDLYRKKEIDEVLLVYTHFSTVLSLVPSMVKLLPAESIEKEGNMENRLIEYEPSAEEVLNRLVKDYISITIFGAMIESAASEQASRRNSMKNATDNANDMLESLSLRFNRARQAQITQEITEIVSGANALN
ncbi:MAG: ATP synthase F1 subunit gamma [Eubacteriales bacterium]|uniref:ATP synthase F1 subunit gamma n=1 Tax=Fenollaria sp. TaxID=1965292 RepID=UPI002A758094|nr:ATP synthase F1 subunit gamma [Fenollaria sp.]MDD7339187.1 ATP synthase F1 subunit gamma [Eubacteriales bacterium]MDY3106183.1 ATP synthase F1 subunit gamma [Fenollaria sp.]